MRRIRFGLLSIVCCICSSAGAANFPNASISGPLLNVVCSLSDEDKPDLVITELDFIEHPTYDIAYQFTVMNVGTAPANLADISVQAVMSVDNIFDITEDIPAGGRIAGHGLLQPDQTITGIYGVPASFNPTSHPYLVLMVDYWQKIDESNETNNTRAIRYGDEKPDLAIEQLYFIDHPIYDVAYRFVIKNIGKTPVNTDDVTAQAVMSTDAVFDILGDIPCGGVTLKRGLLQPDQTLTYDFGATISFNPATHPYFVLMVDSQQNVKESNETNNTRAIRNKTGEDAETPVIFTDPRLKALVETTLSISEPTPTEMLYLIDLDAYDKRISDLTGLEYAQNLSSLNLFLNFISDLSPLSHLMSLTVLDIGRNQISDLSPLSQLTNLTELRLFVNQIADLSALSPLIDLNHLGLGANQISDLSALSSLTNLNYLDVQGNQISDLFPLVSLTNLTVLRLNHNQISDLSILPPLVNLTRLDLGGNEISNLSALIQFPNLVQLELSANQISDLSALPHLRNLKYLSLGFNYISDLSPLSSFTNLTDLYLGGNQITDCSALSQLSSLTYLGLWDNGVADLAFLSKLRNLRYLDLQNNQVSDLVPLSPLTNLTELNLYNNNASDLSPLSRLASLTHLTLNDNQISNLSPLSSLGKLTELQLMGNQIADISDLTELTELRALYLIRNPLSCVAYCNDIPIIRNENPYLSVFMYDPQPSNCVCQTPSKRVLFVDAGVSKGQDGLSWHRAFPYLQDALAVSVYGDEIRIAQGTYRPDQGLGIALGDRTVSFQVRAGVRLKGGYAGLGGGADPNQRDIERFVTILDGDLSSNDDQDWDGWSYPYRQDNSEHVVSIAHADSTTLLDGFTISGGHTLAGYGGGVTDSSAPRTRSNTFNNCVFTNNFATRGGGVYCTTDLDLAKCTFVNNHAVHYGGAIYGSHIKANNCLFYDNAVAFSGGGVYASNGSEYADCLFVRNSARVAGALHYVRLDLPNSIDPYNNINTQVVTFDHVTLQENIASSHEPNAVYMRNGAMHLLGDLDLKDGRFDISSVLIKGNGSFNIGDQALLKIIGGDKSYPTFIRSTIHGPGNIEIDPGTRLVLDANGVINLSGVKDQLPDPDTGGRIIVHGSLIVQGNATLEGTNVDVKRLDVNTPNDIQYNNITLLEASAGFGGEFFVSGNAKITHNNIISEGDRYLDMDPDPDAREQPHISNNHVTVIIKEGTLSDQGTLLELRAKDYDFSSFGTSGAHWVHDSQGFTEDPSENWVLEKLILEPGSKLNLTNRQGFEFQDFSEPDPETVYVRELVMRPNSVLNTALQTLYYQDLVLTDSNGIELDRNPAHERIPKINGAEIKDIPLLGFSLGIIAMNDQTEFDVRVRKDPINPNSANPDDQYIRRLDGIDAIPSRAGGIMEMRTWMSSDEQADVVTAKGSFNRAGDEDITIEFEYLFPDQDPGDASLVVYLSDQWEVSHESRVPVAIIYPPDSGRPGAWDSNEFSVFSITIPRGDLNFTHGTYVELELHGHNVHCWIDNWDPRVACLVECGDYDADFGVTISDYLLLLAEYGRAHPQYCLDVFSDGCVNIDDLMIWHEVSLCGQEEDTAEMLSSFSAQAMSISGPDNSIQATGLVLYGKTGNEYWEEDGYLFDLDVRGAFSGYEKTEGRGRLIANTHHSLYQIRNKTGLICLKGPGEDIKQDPKVSAPNNKTLALGFNGNPENSVALMDAVFHPHEPDVVYVIPVLVKDVNDVNYPAAAKLRLSQNATDAYTVEAVYGLNPATDYRPHIETLAKGVIDPPMEPDYQRIKEIEINRSGRYVYMLSSHIRNKNNWLMVYKEETGDLIKAFNFDDPCDIGDPLNLLPDVNAPSALIVSHQEVLSMQSGLPTSYDRLYLTFSAKSDQENDDFTAKVYSFLLDVNSLETDANIPLQLDRVITIDCNGFEPGPNILNSYEGIAEPNRYASVITSMTEDPNGTLYAVGFTAPSFYDEQDWGLRDVYFTTPFLAIIESNLATVSVQHINGVALPLSVAWCGVPTADQTNALDLKDANSITMAQMARFADSWLKSTQEMHLSGSEH